MRTMVRTTTSKDDAELEDDVDSGGERAREERAREERAREDVNLEENNLGQDDIDEDPADPRRG